MTVADIFELPSNFDPEPQLSSARRLGADMRKQADGLAAQLLSRASLEVQSAALTLYLLGGRARQRVDDATRAVHRVALLCLAIEQHKDALVDPDESATAIERDRDSLSAIARGDRDDSCGPRGEFVLHLRRMFAALPGWEHGQQSFEIALQALLDTHARDCRQSTHPQGGDASAIADEIRGNALDLLIEATCIASRDQSRATHDDGANLVSRLSKGLVGLATEVSRFERGRGSPEAIAWISHRFEIPTHAIQLDDDELRAALRATLSLEFYDLLEATYYLPQDQPRPEIVRRAVTTALERHQSAHALTTALKAHPATTATRRADVMRQMRRVAASKGQISEDERELLRGMDARLFRFQDLLDEMQQGHLDFEEFTKLRSRRRQIVDDLFRIALADEKITGDERKLLLKAMQVLPSLRSGLY